LCSGAAFSFERLVELAMKASILDRLLVVFTEHVDSSNLGDDCATPEGLEAHRLGTSGLTFGGDIRASVVRGMTPCHWVTVCDVSTEISGLIFKGQNVKERYSDILTFQSLTVASKRRESVVQCHGVISSRTDSLN
jgi:hypothetical protein